jgi:hypothetical protein
MIEISQKYESEDINIPKCIFQTSKNPIPVSTRVMLSKYISDWEYKHFNDEQCINFFKEFPIDDFPNIIDVFNSLKGPHKADLFRYYYLYKFGGVFLDSDAMLTKNIDSIVLNYKFFSVNSCYEKNTIFQGFIGAIPNHPVIYLALKDIYEIDSNKLNEYYSLIIGNLYDILQNFSESRDWMLLEEKQNDVQSAKVCNSHGETVMIHYFKTKIVPEYHPNSIQNIKQFHHNPIQNIKLQKIKMKMIFFN